MIEKVYHINTISPEVLDKISKKTLSTTIQTIEIGGFIIGKVTRKKFSSSGIYNFFNRFYEIDIIDFIHCANTSLTKEKNYKTDFKLYKNQVANEFIQSHGEHKIIGDWHSHPGKQPFPSEDDDKVIAHRMKFHSFYISGIVSLSPDMEGLFNFNLFIYQKSGFFSKIKARLEVGYTWERPIKIIK